MNFVILGLAAPPPSSSAGVLLVVFGEKAYRLARVLEEGGVVSVQCGCEVVKLTDWVLDAVLLNWTDWENYELVCVSAHNVLTHHLVTRGQSLVTHYHSQVNCILYVSFYSTCSFSFLSYFSLQILSSGAGQLSG